MIILKYEMKYEHSPQTKTNLMENDRHQTIRLQVYHTALKQYWSGCLDFEKEPLPFNVYLMSEIVNKCCTSTVKISPPEGAISILILME